MNIKPFEPIEGIASEIEEEFSEELVPVRYYKLINNLSELGVPGENLYAIVIYGLRRTGKTYASVMLAKKAEEYGYESYYYEVTPEDEYFDPGVSGKLGRELSNRVLEGKNLFLVIDEAFNKPISSRRRFLEPFRRVYLNNKKFFIILVGSYVYDISGLDAEISRIFMSQRASLIPTMPRTSRIRLSDHPIYLYEHLASNTYIDLSGIIELLSNRDFIIDHELSDKLLRIYYSYENSLGIPSVISGKEKKSSAINAIIKAIRYSFEEPLLKDKISKRFGLSRVKFVEFVDTINKIFRKKTLFGTLAEKLALNTGLVIPAVYLEGEGRIPELIARYKPIIENELYSRLNVEARPSSLLAYEILRRLGVSMPVGYREESIVVNALIEHALYFENYYADALMTKMPIFTYKSVDFVYHFGDKIYLIEVKTNLSHPEEILETIRIASENRLVPIILVPYKSLEGIGTLDYKFPTPLQAPGYRFDYGELGGVALYEGRAKEFVEEYLLGENLIYPVIRPIELFFVLFGAPRELIE